MCKTILLLLACFVSSTAFARDVAGQYTESPYHDWYEEQQDQYGISCCGNADAQWYDGRYKLNSDGTVTLNLPAGDLVVELYKVLHGPNPTGHPVWWQNAIGMTYCFAPGSQG